MNVRDEETGNEFVNRTDPVSVDALVHCPAVQNGLSESDESLGTHPFDRPIPFFVDLVGAFGVPAACVTFPGIGGLVSPTEGLPIGIVTAALPGQSRQR
jgi:hypothetical protein